MLQFIVGACGLWMMGLTTHEHLELIGHQCGVVPWIDTLLQQRRIVLHRGLTQTFQRCRRLVAGTFSTQPARLNLQFSQLAF